MSEMTEFLLARIAEDEAVAQRALKTWALIDLNVSENDDFYARSKPGRILAECDAKRQMLALLEEVNDQGIPRLTIYTRDLLPRLLALPYADHPDYDERWRP